MSGFFVTLVLLVASLTFFVASAVVLANQQQHPRLLSSLKQHHKDKKSNNATTRREADSIHSIFNAKTFLRPDSITISGISAGAIMATQFEYSFSSIINAAGIIAGVPYFCSQGTLPVALSCMTKPDLIDVTELDSIISVWEATGQIDSFENLARHMVFMWSGKSDTVVYQGTMKKLAAQYSAMGVGSITTLFNFSAEHAWISPSSKGHECDYLGSPFVNRCMLDGAPYDFFGEYGRRAFAWMSDQNKIPHVAWNGTRGSYIKQNLYQFSQAIYGAGPELNSMGKIGLLYVPKQCGTVTHVSSSDHSLELRNASKKCHFHINFHGCLQEFGSIGTQYIDENGVGEWAESNDIVVLYPQTAKSLGNPKACFAWWCFAAPDCYTFATKYGTQIRMMAAMMKNLINAGIV